MSEHSDGLDPGDCTEIYDTGAALMAIAHPTPAGGLAAVGTHWAGEYFCNGGTLQQSGPPPDYFDGKLGYDPAHDTPPTFSPSPDTLENSPMDIGPDAVGFDYGTADDHAANSGFDYAAADSHDAYSGSNSGGSGGSSDGGSSGGSTE